MSEKEKGLGNEAVDDMARAADELRLPYSVTIEDGIQSGLPPGTITFRVSLRPGDESQAFYTRLWDLQMARSKELFGPAKETLPDFDSAGRLKCEVD